jgi:sugar lactone lactonase YvrE
MRRLSCLPLFLCAPFIVGACGEAASSPSAEVAIDSLPNGAVHVFSPEAGIWEEGERWRLVEEVRIGAMDGTGPDVFGNIAGLAADDDGRIYVADSQASEIRIFAPDGRHLRTIGREGAGPGEFRQISGMDWDPEGRLWVMDAGNSRFAVVDPEEGFVESFRRDMGFRMFPWPGRLDRQGNLHDLIMVEGEGNPMERERAVVRYAGGDLSPLDTLVLPSFQASTFDLSGDDGRRLVSAASLLADAVLDRGARRRHLDRNERPVSHPPGLALRRHDADPRASLQAGAVSATERQEAIDGLEWFTNQGGRIDASRIPDTKPAFGRLFEDEAGYLWVTATVAEGEPRRFDVFDPDGRYLGAVEAPEGLGFIPAPRDPREPPLRRGPGRLRGALRGALPDRGAGIALASPGDHTTRLAPRPCRAMRARMRPRLTADRSVATLWMCLTAPRRFVAIASASPTAKPLGGVRSGVCAPDPFCVPGDLEDERDGNDDVHGLHVRLSPGRGGRARARHHGRMI